jgi:hypothetical protein
MVSARTLHSYYHKWPTPLTQKDLAKEWYMHNLTPREELAASLATAGHCLVDNLRFDHALEAYHRAGKLVPRDRALLPPLLGQLLGAGGVIHIARAISVQFTADTRRGTPEGLGDFLLHRTALFAFGLYDHVLRQ